MSIDQWEQVQSYILPEHITSSRSDKGRDEPEAISTLPEESRLGPEAARTLPRPTTTKSNPALRLLTNYLSQGNE